MTKLHELVLPSFKGFFGLRAILVSVLSKMSSWTVIASALYSISLIVCLSLEALRNIVIVKLLSRVQLFVTPWTVAYQAPPSMGFSKQVYWSGLPFPSPGDLPNPGIEPRSPAL